MLSAKNQNEKANLAFFDLKAGDSHRSRGEDSMRLWTFFCATDVLPEIGALPN